MKLDQAIFEAESGRRLSIPTANALYDQADLLTLGQLAQKARFRHNPEHIVTYAIDRNINYTNICISGCRFCAFWRPAGHPQAYVLDDAALTEKVEVTKALGGTHILFQGGMNPDIDLDRHEDQIRLIRSFGLKLHGYSPPEIVFFAKRFGFTIEQVIERFVKAGLNSIPGGGAEILVDRVRRLTSPGKATSREWLSVMAQAHKMGLRTTATMMFGHVESPHERLVHLIRLRRLQDQTGGFTSFIPWPYQPGPETVQVKPASVTEYLRMLAISRLVLDNFDHVQASWVTQGADIGQVALMFGADDLGSTMIEENVVAAAGVSHRLTKFELVDLIAWAGFQARQSDAVYEIIN